MADFKSTDLLNAIRNGASSEYQNRVPVATQNNLAQVGTAIMDYSQVRNEFVASLFDKIGLSVIKNKLFENPLREFKKGTLDWGKDIEEIFVDIVQAQSYDASVAESELFKRNLPDIKAIFHRMNRQDMYKTTIENNQLKLAFQSETGFNSLLDKVIQTLYTSDNYDEFTLMKHLIQQYGVEGKFKMIAVTPVTDTDSAKAAMTKIKEISNKLTFMSKEYNYAGVHTSTPKEDQIILIDTAFDALVDVEVLASAFNMEKADFIGRRILIDDFGGLTNVLCAVVDRDWFLVYDRLINSDEVYNQQGMYYNYFLHHWQTLSTSLFANAVLFVTVEPTIDSITISPATATTIKGGAVQFTTEADGTGNPSSKVIYTHNGTDSFISSTGLLIVGKDETVASITVTATSVIDDTVTDTATVTVSDIVRT